MLGIALHLAIAIQQFDGVVIEANKLQEQNLFPEAERTYLHALSTASALGSETHAYALALNNLAALRYRMGRYDRARTDYTKAMEIWRALGNEKDLAACLSNFAELVHAQGNDREALKYAEEALEIRRRISAASPYASTIHGNILRSLGRHKEGVQVLREAAQESKRSDPGTARQAFALTSLTQAELSLGNHVEALQAAQESLAIWEKIHGRQSGQYASALSLRARAWRAEGEFQNAERDLREAKTITERVLNEDHPRLIALLADLADVVGRRGKHDDAIALLTRAQSIAENSLGAAHPDQAALLLALGDQHRAMKNLESARDYYSNALKTAEAVYGPDNPNLGSYLNNYATNLHELGQLADAESLFRRALAARESLFGPMHISNAETLHNLAVVCAQRRELKDARGFIERSLAIRQQYLGGGHSSLISPLVVYSYILEQSGEKKRAKEIRNRAALLEISRPETRHKVDIKALKSFR